MRVLLDTNALLMPGQFGIDLFTELQGMLGSVEPCVIPGTRSELEKIARGKGRDAAAARLALGIFARCTVLAWGETGASVDEQIVRCAASEGSVVVTNDRALRNRLLQEGLRVISLRRQKALTMIRR
ncbi:MAG: nucleotide-binding protein [Methanomicrobiales archaeon]|nr:nucleotide-binding protein [Methanomicrobiales archaeon]